MGRGVGCAGLALLLLAAAPAARADEPAHVADPAAGQRLALTVCVACHFVTAEHAAETILVPPAPPLRAIANRPGMTDAALGRFLTTVHPGLANARQMPNPRLTDDQVSDVVAYLAGLRRPAPDGERR